MYTFFKRVIDIFIPLISVIITLPFTLIIIIILKITDEGEVFFSQERIGLNNMTFKLFKFVTMRKGSINSGSITYKNDPRILPFGKFLRKAKINELPQLINVLIGDMSLVGPRPLFEEGFKLYPKEVRKLIYKDNKPGLTGMGSLFFLNEEEMLMKLGKDIKTSYRDDIMPVKGTLELWYRNNKSFWLDLRIIIITAISILIPKAKIYLNSFDLPLDIRKLLIKI